MIVRDGEIDSINVTHKGDLVGEVIAGSHRLIADTENALGTVRNWTQLQLTDGEQHAFAVSLHAAALVAEDGLIVGIFESGMGDDRGYLSLFKI